MSPRRYALALVALGAAGTTAAAPSPGPEPAAICVDCYPDPPPPDPEDPVCPRDGACFTYVINYATNTCERQNKAAGTACDDGRACTYGDTCNANGTCVGSAITCATTGCEARTCNGTSTCSVSPAPSGTVCRAAAGPCDVDDRCDGTTFVCPSSYAETGAPCIGAMNCTCTSTHACVAQTNVTLFCYDARGNVTATSTVPTGDVCDVCPPE